MTATVLIVDDEETARNFISEALSDAGYEAIEAGTLKEANKAIDKGVGDIILLENMNIFSRHTHILNQVNCAGQ